MSTDTFAEFAAIINRIDDIMRLAFEYYQARNPSAKPESDPAGRYGLGLADNFSGALNPSSGTEETGRPAPGSREERAARNLAKLMEKTNLPLAYYSRVASRIDKWWRSRLDDGKGEATVKHMLSTTGGSILLSLFLSRPMGKVAATPEASPDTSPDTSPKTSPKTSPDAVGPSKESGATSHQAFFQTLAEHNKEGNTSSLPSFFTSLNAINLSLALAINRMASLTSLSGSGTGAVLPRHHGAPYAFIPPAPTGGGASSSTALTVGETAVHIDPRGMDKRIKTLIRKWEERTCRILVENSDSPFL